MQPLGEEDVIHPQQTPTEERPRARRTRPTSIVVGTIDVPIRDRERDEDSSPHRVRDASQHQARDTPPRRARVTSPNRARSASPHRAKSHSPRRARDSSPRRTKGVTSRRAGDTSPRRTRDVTSRRARDSSPRHPSKSSSRRPSDDDEPTRDEELEQLRTTLKDMSSKIHYAISSAPELEKVLEETQRSPFTARISKVRVRHTKLKLAKFEGDSDPKQFLTTISIAIARAHFSAEERDAGSCQIFVEHLSGAALRWFSRLEANSIDSFNQLSTAFLKHYSMYIEKGASNAELWTIAQGPKESLRKFIGRFKAIITTVDVPDEAAIAALKKAVWHESRFFEDISLNHPMSLEDALHRATRFIEFEEEKSVIAKQHTVPKTSEKKEKPREEYYEPRQHYDRDYVNDDKGKKASSYHVGGSSSPSQKPWNKYYRNDDVKDRQPYCDYHKRPGHATEECRHLQAELLTQFKEGKLKLDHGRSPSARENDEPRQAAHNHNTEHGVEKQKRNHDAPRQEDNAPVPRRRINMIMGGLTSCRDSVRSIKSYRRQATTRREWVKKNAPTFTNTDPITFTEEDAAGLIHPHNDPLVVELIIYESIVTKVLIDTGSSVNVIFKGALEQMEIDLCSVKADVQPLTGFDGDTIMTVGTATFPIYVGGLMTWCDFAIVDKPVVYNVILGTPWIHRMKAVASTYHQCVKFPTPRGIFTLRGDPMVARTCFMIERKQRYAKSSVDQTVAEPLAHSGDQTATVPLMEFRQP